MSAARSVLKHFGFNNRYDQAAVDRSSQVLGRTPFLLFDKDVLINQVNLWKAAMQDIPGYFAIKSCSATEIIKLFNERGMCFDAATDGEITYLEELGIPGSKVVRTRPICANDDMEILKRFKPKAIVVEYREGVEILRRAGIPNKEYQPTLLVRLDIGMGNLQKFGCQCAVDRVKDGRPTVLYDHRPALSIINAARRAEKEFGAPYGSIGLTAHPGTNTTDPDIYGVLMGIYHLVSRNIYRDSKKAGDPMVIRSFDIGGGFPDAEYAALANTSQRVVLEGVHRRVSKFRNDYERDFGFVPEVIAEPGRFLVADAAVSVSRAILVDRKNEYRLPNNTTVRGQNLVVRLDDGVYGSMMGKIHDDKLYQPKPFRIDELAEPFSSKMTLCKNVWGPTCDSVDGVRKADQQLMYRDELKLPDNLKTGDCFIVPHLGAYSLVTSTAFNDTLPPRVVFVQKKEDGYEFSIYDTLARNLLGEGITTGLE
jgi:ornithine decarboxylase